MVKFNLRGDCLPRCSSWVLALTAPMPSGPEPYISSGNFRIEFYLSLRLYTSDSPLKLRSEWRGVVEFHSPVHHEARPPVRCLPSAEIGARREER
jgi:hypothetical protein